ncbi:putative halogenase [Phlebopus sp. FC_14]|nr:putative halogenase [Phlebopus sp. FC_14]
MTQTIIPTSAQILVVGGGPAGSYAAAALAREGFNVVVLEAAAFPRYHIGESLLPSVRHFLKFIDAERLVVAHGFTPKPGAAVKLNQHKREGYTDFVALSPDHGAWNVIRSEFDDLLLTYAATCGARVIQRTRVTDIHFDEHNSNRPIAASWKNDAGREGFIHFDYLVDASGRNGIMSTKYLRNRCFNKGLQNVACWGYWEGTGCYMPNTNRENAIWIEALEDESGWAWFIPLHDNSTSVGIVMDQKISMSKKSAAREKAGVTGHSLEDHYLAELQRTPGVIKLLANGKLRRKGESDAVKTAGDFSYAATSYAGDHYRIAGDAGAFIDPFFSSGVHLALTGGLSAAVTIAASIRKTASEDLAQTWHSSKVGTSYTRFLLVVLGTYKQIRSQSFPVMSDIDEDNFDRAFSLIRPVIQGTADVGKVVTEDELQTGIFQKTMDFCRHIFAPTDPAMHASVASRLDPNLVSPACPVITEDQINQLVAEDDEEAKLVLCEINARKPIHAMYTPTQHFQLESHFGHAAVLKRGHLGLYAVPSDS